MGRRRERVMSSLPLAARNVVVQAVLLAACLFSPTSLQAQERRGADIQLERRDGGGVNGELLEVDGSGVRVLDPATHLQVVVSLSDVRSLRIVKKSRILAGTGVGLIGGALAGAAVAMTTDDNPMFRGAGWAALAAAVFGAIGGAAGAVAGAVKGADEVVSFEGKTPADRSAVIARLQRYARLSASSVALLAEDESAGIASPVQGFRRLHVGVGLDYVRSAAIGDLKEMMHSVGFDHGDDVCFFGCTHIDYPRVERATTVVPDVRLDYSLNRTWAVGLTYFSTGRHSVTGREEIPGVDYRPSFLPSTALAASYWSDGLAVTASRFPIPDPFLRKDTLRMSVGVGIGRVRASLEGGPYAGSPALRGNPLDVRESDKTVPAVLVAASWVRFFSRSLSSYAGIQYRYMPFTMEAGTISAQYRYYPVPETFAYGAVPVEIAARTMNAGGFGITVGMGFHR
jgi:hypothetical protein